MLNQIFESGYYSIHEGFESWEDAVRASVQPMIDKGAVLPAYANSIVDSVKKFGPYIVIAPDIAIPHAEDKANVVKTSIGFMKSNRAVSFSDDPEQDARLFFVLASNDEAKHLENLKALMQLLCDEELVEKLVACQNEEAFRQLVAEYNH